MAKAGTSHDESGLDQLEADFEVRPEDAADAARFRRMVRAAEAREAAEQELRDAVRAARAAGDPWVVVAVALGMSAEQAEAAYADLDD